MKLDNQHSKHGYEVKKLLANSSSHLDGIRQELYQCSVAELAQAAQESILQADVNLAQIEISDSPEVE